MIDDENASKAQPASAPLPDAHGQAALLLVESLLHGLCENATLTSTQAADIAERALDVQVEYAEAADGAAAPMRRAHLLLSSIAASLNVDRPDEPATV